MNLIINLDNTVLNISEKYKEINDFVINQILDILDKKKVNKNLILNQLNSYYKTYKEQFGVSINTYINSVLSVVSFHSGYCYSENPAYALGFLESFIDNVEQFKEFFKYDYSYCYGGFEFIKDIKNSFNKIIVYGESTDDLYEYKINQVIDDLEELIFTNHYIVPEKDPITMESIFLTEAINPEETIVITSNVTEANIANTLGAKVIYIKNTPWYQKNNRTFINYDAIDFTVIDNLKEILLKEIEVS
ncbi:MAG: hypothetical protein ACOCRK_05450 [bacterium]